MRPVERVDRTQLSAIEQARQHHRYARGLLRANTRDPSIDPNRGEVLSDDEKVSIDVPDRRRSLLGRNCYGLRSSGSRFRRPNGDHVQLGSEGAY